MPRRIGAPGSTHRRRVGALAALILGVGCNGSRGGAPTVAASSACRNAGRGSLQRGAGDDRELTEAAVAAERRALDRILGGFARGDIAVYAGRATARENLSAIGRADARLDGPVVAGLHTTSWGPTLTLAGTSDDALIELFASSVEPHAIASTGIISPGVGAGEAARCRSCLVPLATAPPRVVLPRSAFRGAYGTGQARVVEVEVALDRVAPEAVTLAQVRRLLSHWSPGDASALVRADRGVGAVTLDVRGAAGVPVYDERELATSERSECLRVAEYTARWRITTPRLGDSRVDDVCITRVVRRCCASASPTTPCSSPPPPGCVEREERPASDPP